MSLERDAFINVGGVGLLVQIFHIPAFVGDAVLRTNDVRSLNASLISLKMSDENSTIGANAYRHDLACRVLSKNNN